MHAVGPAAHSSARPATTTHDLLCVLELGLLYMWEHSQLCFQHPVLLVSVMSAPCCLYCLHHCQVGSLASMDKALSCMDEAKRKKLEEMVQEAAQGRKPGATAAAGAAARPGSASRAGSRGPSAPASVSVTRSVLAATWQTSLSVVGVRVSTARPLSRPP